MFRKICIRAHKGASARALGAWGLDQEGPGGIQAKPLGGGGAVDQDHSCPHDWGQPWDPQTLTPGGCLLKKNQAVSSLLLRSQVGEADKN